MSLTCQNTHTKAQNIPPAGFLGLMSKCTAAGHEAGSHLIAQAAEFSATGSGSQRTAQALPGSNDAESLRQPVCTKQSETNEKTAIEAIKEHGKGYPLAGLFSRTTGPNNASAKPLQHAIESADAYRVEKERVMQSAFAAELRHLDKCKAAQSAFLARLKTAAAVDAIESAFASDTGSDSEADSDRDGGAAGESRDRLDAGNTVISGNARAAGECAIAQGCRIPSALNAAGAPLDSHARATHAGAIARAVSREPDSEAIQRATLESAQNFCATASDKGANTSKHETADTATATTASNDARMTKASGNIGGGIGGINECPAPGGSKASGGGGTAGDGALMDALSAERHASAADVATQAKASDKAEPSQGFSFAASRPPYPGSIGRGAGNKTWAPPENSSIPISDPRKSSCEFLNDVEISGGNRNTDLEHLNSGSVFDVLATTQRAWIVDFASSALRNQQFAPSEIEESTATHPALIRRSQHPAIFDVNTPSTETTRQL